MLLETRLRDLLIIWPLKHLNYEYGGSFNLCHDCDGRQTVFTCLNILGLKEKRTGLRRVIMLSDAWMFGRRKKEGLTLSQSIAWGGHNTTPVPAMCL